MEQSKKNISVRLTASDIKKIKEIAERIGVKYSDLFRFSVKSMLTRLMPLHDKELRGADLIPTLLECGEELMDYFDIDSEQLDRIVNEGVVDRSKRVDTEDLDLMVLSYLNQNYGVKKLSEVSNANIEAADVNEVLKHYLYEKYVIDRSGRAQGQRPEAEQEFSKLEPLALGATL